MYSANQQPPGFVVVDEERQHGHLAVRPHAQVDEFLLQQPWMAACA